MISADTALDTTRRKPEAYFEVRLNVETVTYHTLGRFEYFT